MLSPYKTFVVFDLETGGLSSDKNPTLEIAMCIVNNRMEDLEEYSSLIKPYGGLKIEDGALKANGLTIEQCENQGKSVDIVVKEVIDILKKYGTKKGIILVGHNINSFDIPFLESLFSFCKKNLGDFVNTSVTIDTLDFARFKWLESSDYKLGTCCQNLGIDLVDAHRSMSDTLATKKLFIDFMLNLRGAGCNIEKTDNKIPVAIRFRENFKI